MGYRNYPFLFSSVFHGLNGNKLACDINWARDRHVIIRLKREQMLEIESSKF